MDSTFNFRRFGLLFKKTIIENWVQIFGVFAIAVVISWLFYPHIEPDTENMWSTNDIQLISMVGLSLLIIGYNIVGLFATNFSNTAKSYQFLLQPVSRLEHWLNIVLVVAILFPSLFLILFRLIDIYQVSKYHASLDRESFLYTHNYAKASVQSFTDFSFIKLMSIYISTMAVLVIGALYFKKSALIKTSIILICLYFFFTFLNSSLVTYYFGKQPSYFVSLFEGITFHQIEGDSFKLVHTPSVSTIFQIIYLFSLPVVLWLIALLRLREKEV